MGFDAFLKLDKIPGESEDERYKDSIEVLSFSWGVRQPSGGGRTGGQGERCDFDNFTFTKTVDKTSPLLAKACASGKVLKKADLVLCRATGDKVMYYAITLIDVVVAGVKMEGKAAGESGLPLETVSLNFSVMMWEYYPTDHKTGRRLGTVTAMWSLAQGRDRQG